MNIKSTLALFLFFAIYNNLSGQAKRDGRPQKQDKEGKTSPEGAQTTDAPDAPMLLDLKSLKERVKPLLQANVSQFKEPLIIMLYGDNKEQTALFSKISSKFLNDESPVKSTVIFSDDKKKIIALAINSEMGLEMICSERRISHLKFYCLPGTSYIESSKNPEIITLNQTRHLVKLIGQYNVSFTPKQEQPVPGNPFPAVRIESL